MEVDFDKLKFMPYRSYMGLIDDAFGVDMFWYEKILIFMQYLQRLALLTMFTVPWPVFFTQYSRYLLMFLLDFTAHHGGVSALGAGTIFDGCEIGCKTMWGVFGVVTLLTWALVASWERFSLYYTVNVERFFWGFIQLMFLPFCNVLVRYYMLSREGRLYGTAAEWTTPLSELGVVLLVLLVCCFFGIGYARMSRLVLFISPIRHETYLKSRELEYLLHFTATYRNERVWMISHYTLQAWWWSLARCGVDLALLFCMAFASEHNAIVLATVIIAAVILFLIFGPRVHRCVSSNWLELVSNIALFIFAIIGVLQVFEVQNALLVDNVLAEVILGIEGGAILLCFCMCIYFYIDGHTFRWTTSVADKRAARRWKKYHSPEVIRQNEEQQMLMSMKNEIAIAQDREKAGKSNYNPYNYESEDIHLHSQNVGREEEDFIRALRRMDAQRLAEEMKKREANMESSMSVAERDTRRSAESLQDKFIGIDAASPHTWPMNESIVSELMRRNTTDHLVDYLRASRKLLDRISILHNSPMLVPTDEIKMHIGRLEKSVQYCKLERITHHSNIIHPLQPTFEELIEQLTYELRIFSKKSVTQGHNARKMIEVSRFLRIKMDQREKALALLSPQMRRILLKMFALRILIQLIFEKKESLLPKKYNAGDELRRQDEKDRRRRRRQRRKRKLQAQQKAAAAAADGEDVHQEIDAFYDDSEDDDDFDDNDMDLSTDDDDYSEDDDVDLRQKLHAYDDPFAANNHENFGEGVDVIDAFRRDDDDDLSNQQDDMDMTHQMQLAEMLRKNKEGNRGGKKSLVNGVASGASGGLTSAYDDGGMHNRNTGAAAFAGDDDDEDGSNDESKKNR